MSDDEWISTAEAAEILGLSAMTVRRRVDEGEILGRRSKPPLRGWRKVSRASVEAYKAKMAEQAGGPVPVEEPGREDERG